jgi:hypothetical protein
MTKNMAYGLVHRHLIQLDCFRVWLVYLTQALSMFFMTISTIVASEGYKIQPSQPFSHRC